MKDSDLLTVLILYGVCGLFGGMALELRPAARIYPLCLTGILCGLNTLFLFRCLIRAYSDAAALRLVNDLSGIFSGFVFRQFFFVIFACLGYMLIMRYAGFYLAGLLYLLAVLAYFRVRPLYIIYTIGILGSLVWGVFDVFLKVPLPQGVIFD